MFFSSARYVIILCGNLGKLSIKTDVEKKKKKKKKTEKRGGGKNKQRIKKKKKKNNNWNLI